MNKRSTTIALNGRLYDVKTGQLLPSNNLRTPQKRAVQHRAKTVDGFTRLTARPTSTPVQKHSVSEPKKPKKYHQKAAEAHKVHQKTVKTRTLMRSSVQKPLPSKIHGVRANSKSIGEAVQAVIQQQDLHKKRLDHAKQISKSKSISKFGDGTDVFVSKKYSTSLGVQPAPSLPAANPNSHAQEPHHGPSYHMVQTAIHKAVSHQQTAVKKHNKKLGISRRAINIGAISAIAVIIAGFTAIHNSANMAMKVAASRSGVTGSLPGYKPAGFSLKPLQYDRGQIVLTYLSNSDSNRSYSITQTSSNWSNSDLEQRHLAANPSSYHKYNYNGSVFYVHDGDATWIKNGTWYNLSSQAQLSNDQLLKVASSF